MARPCFEIGIVMAGAVSAGAYTAGVMDFLIEALDAYEAAKAEPGWDGPTHDVRIPVMAGASAGGMTSAISALHAFRDAFDHVWPTDPGRGVPNRRRNRLYSSWVEDIDIKPLLEATDLARGKATEPARSLLCCDVIDAIVEEAFDLDGALRSPNWIGSGDDRTLRLFLTLTNLRGVPYSFQLYGADDPRRYGMLNHGDFLDFRLGLKPAPLDGVHALDVGNASGPGWDLFRGAVKATGAFPIGLAPRPLARAATDYFFSSRVGYYSSGSGGFEPVPPDDWMKGFDRYEFVAVDGGVIDNEPLELARRHLSGGPDRRNASDGFTTTKAVVLVAPFPNYAETARDKAADFSDLGLMNVARRLFSTMLDQARFKPDELGRAQDETYYSRYIVAPSRETNASPQSRKYPIACGVLNGFGGFLHRSFRRHDYLLGRRNAQAFLRFNFVLPDNAELFRGAPIDLDKWRVKEAEKPGLKYFRTNIGAQPGLPIIPLTPALRREIVIGEQDLPDTSEFLSALFREDLNARIESRARAVVNRIVDVDLKFDGLLGPVKRLGAKAVGAEFVSRAAGDAVSQALEDVEKAFFPPI